MIIHEGIPAVKNYVAIYIIRLFHLPNNPSYNCAACILFNNTLLMTNVMQHLISMTLNHEIREVWEKRVATCFKVIYCKEWGK
jgi:hypothetical protein